MIRNRKILFCEDSIVRGTQLRGNIDYLFEEHSAEEVHMIPACPPLIYGCQFLNFSRSKDENELAARRAIEIMKHYLMQVGYDEETKSFDIDRLTTGITASKRSKTFIVRDALTHLENRVGKLIPMEELINEVGAKLEANELEDSLSLLEKEGFIFRPKKGFVQRL